MKLLIVTQVVDINHPILGFFHRWIIEFAKHCEQVHVIALQVGEYDLPSNVKVHSLGKEDGVGRLEYIYRFYSYVWKLRDEYDHVFVHMNAEYVVLVGWLWRLWGKRVGLWYNHTVGSFCLRVARFFVNTLFYTSPYAFPSRYAQARQMPAGIDTEVFYPRDVEKKPKSIYFQGRVAPAKRVHVILEAFEQLRAKDPEVSLTIVGPEDEEYVRPLKEKYKKFIEDGSLVFKGPVSHKKTPELFSAHAVSVNLTDDGNYDKTVLESLACGTPCIVSSRAFSDAPVASISTPSAVIVAEAFLNMAKFASVETFVQYVQTRHSIEILGMTLYSIYARN